MIFVIADNPFSDYNDLKTVQITEEERKYMGRHFVERYIEKKKEV